MKLCFSTLGCFDKGLEDILLLAKSFSVAAIELRGIGGALENDDIAVFLPEHRESTRQKLFQSGLELPVLGTSCSFHRKERLNSSIEAGKRAIRIAEALGIKAIRVFGDRLTEDRQDGTERIADGILQLCEASQSVDVLLEVHGDFNTVETLAPILDRLGDVRGFGLIWDIEHTHKPYGNDWIPFYRFAKPYVKHVHIKDYSDDRQELTLIGEGSVPIIPIICQLYDDGYEGCLSLEWEKKWHPELPDMERALESFVSLLKKTEIRL